jgi:arylsulfatase A-like enzyme
MDLLPTLCQMAGAKVPDDRTIDGVSMLPIFEGKHLKREIPMYFRWNGCWSDMKIAMRDGDWKLLADGGLKNFELYNLRADPRELHNAAGLRPTARFEQLKRKLTKLHEGIQADMPKDWYWGPPKDEQ